eukprot:gene31358-53654_t
MQRKTATMIAKTSCRKIHKRKLSFSKSSISQSLTGVPAEPNRKRATGPVNRRAPANRMPQKYFSRQCCSIVKTLLTEFNTLTGPTDIAHWRSQIFQRLLMVVALLGTIVAVPSVALAIKEQLWVVAIIDVIAVAWLLVLWRYQGAKHEIRVF